MTTQYVHVVHDIELVVPFGLILLVLLFRPVRPVRHARGWSGCDARSQRASSALVARGRAASSAPRTSSAGTSRSSTSRRPPTCGPRRSTSASRRWGSTCSPATTARCRSATARSSGSARTRPRSSWSRTTGRSCRRCRSRPRSAFVVGVLVGFPALRVKGLYLALVTLGLAVLFPAADEPIRPARPVPDVRHLAGRSSSPRVKLLPPSWVADVHRRATTSGRTTRRSRSPSSGSSRSCPDRAQPLRPGADRGA